VNPYFYYYGAQQQLWLKGGAVVSSSESTGAFPNSGDPIQITLSYDGSNTMTTTWTDLTTSGTYSSSYAVGNLGSALGGSAYFGFTGAASVQTAGFGEGPATQTIGNFSYTYTTASAPFTGNNVLPTSTPLAVASGATVDLYGGNDAVGSLSGAGLVTNSVFGTLAVLTVGNSATTQTFSGVLQDGAGSLGLGVVAPGGLVLTGQNTYSGPTTISGGTLQRPKRQRRLDHGGGRREQQRPAGLQSLRPPDRGLYHRRQRRGDEDRPRHLDAYQRR
jgi:autotransporter-associated beta strand protein